VGSFSLNWSGFVVWISVAHDPWDGNGSVGQWVTASDPWPIIACNFYRATLCIVHSYRKFVRLSVTLVDCAHMVRPTIMISSPYRNPMILVVTDIRFIPRFETKEVIANDGVEWRWRRYELAIFDQNGAIYDKGYYWPLIENRIRAFDWYQNRRPWLTMKWPWTAIVYSVALHTCFFRSQPLNFEWR